MAANYTPLDDEILRELAAGPLHFTPLSVRVARCSESLAQPDRFGERCGWRLVDRRLQALRKRGLIVCDRKTGWSLAPVDGSV